MPTLPGSPARSKRLNESNKPILDMGIADAGNQFILPQNTTDNLAEIPNVKVGSIAYDTTLDEVVINDGTGFSPISSSSGANTSLSNLASPTAINEELTFAPGVEGGLKTSGDIATQTLQLGTGDASVGTSGDVQLFTGVSGGTGGNTGNISIFSGGPNGADSSGDLLCSTGNAFGAGASGSINLGTGTAVDGNSGVILLAVGSVSGAGTQGQIQLQNGSQGTPGQVWTSTDTSGSGSWMAPGTPGFTGATTSFGTFTTNPTSWVNITATSATYDPNHMVNTSGGYSGGGEITIATAGAYLLSAAATSSGGGWTGKAQIAYSTVSGATSPSTVITTLNFDSSISTYQIMDGVQIVYLAAGSVVQYWALSDQSGVNWGSATNAVSLI